MREEKKPESSKYFQIEKIKQRVEKIKKTLNGVKESYEKLPEDIERYVSQEIENEFMMYLNKFNK